MILRYLIENVLVLIQCFLWKKKCKQYIKVFLIKCNFNRVGLFLNVMNLSIPCIKSVTFINNNIDNKNGKLNVKLKWW